MRKYYIIFVDFYSQLFEDKVNFFYSISWFRRVF